MPSLNKEEFLGKVLRQIKFPYDRAGIKAELSDHISERVDHYLELGYDQESAEQAAVSDMGDPTEIGIELNKEHSPLLGWLWKATGILLSLVIAANVIFAVPLLVRPFLTDYTAHIAESAVIYEVVIGETVRLDDRIIHFSKVIYDRTGNLHIFYRHYDVRIRSGWSFANIGTVTDNLGNTYGRGSGGQTGGLVSKGHRVVKGFSREADTLIITYDQYNRKYEIKVPLPVGDVRG